MKTKLVVLAAGMGSRYGGLKQMDPLGPNGEAILEFSAYDAIKAGFDKMCIRDRITAVHLNAIEWQFQQSF